MGWERVLLASRVAGHMRPQRAKEQARLQLHTHALSHTQSRGRARACSLEVALALEVLFQTTNPRTSLRTFGRAPRRQPCTPCPSPVGAPVSQRRRTRSCQPALSQRSIRSRCAGGPSSVCRPAAAPVRLARCRAGEAGRLRPRAAERRCLSHWRLSR